MLKYYIKCLNPIYWFKNYPTNSLLDKALVDLLNKGEKFQSIEEYSANFGKFKLWIGNYPYAFGTLYMREWCGSPSRTTIIRLKERMLEQEFYDEV